MSEMDRLYRLKDLLTTHRSLTLAQIMGKLETSRATANRDIAKLRDQLGVPVMFDRDLAGYCIDKSSPAAELPGVWFSQDEILALLTIQSMLGQLEPGLLGPKLKPLQKRLNAMLEKRGLEPDVLAERVRLLHAGKRRLGLQSFEAVARATLGRKKIRVTHFSRQNGQSTERTLSPQQLVHYRDNWYVDAWCHLRKDVRSFAVDAIQAATVLDEDAKDIDQDSLKQVMQSSYGIFGGQPKAVVKLRFTPDRARWVRQEQWHPQEQALDEPDGSYLLSFPYSDERELVGDILRFGEDVEVLEPPALRAQVKKALLDAAGRYG